MLQSALAQNMENQTSILGSLIPLTLAGVTLVLILYEIWFRNQRYVQMGNKFPGPKSIPILGNAHLAIGKSAAGIFDLVCEMQAKLKVTTARVWLGPRLIIGIGNADDAEVILGNSTHLEKSPDYALFEPWLGDGLLISKGDKWKSHRKMIAPTFHTSILKSFMPVFNKNAAALVASFRKEQGKIFDCHDYMSSTTVDTLLETAMGVTKTSSDNTGFDYAMAVMRMCNILHQRHIKFYLRPDILFNLTSFSRIQVGLLKIIHALTNAVIRRKKENYFERQKKGEESLYGHAVKTSKFDDQGQIIERQEIMPNYLRDDLDENDENDVGEKKRLAFLDYMIEASQTKGNSLTDAEINEEVNTIMFEGHDTTAAASSFTLCILGIYPDIQQKVFAELKEIFANDLHRPITFNDTMQMKYLERVIFETMRMYPPVPIIARKVNEDVKLVTGDYTIPAGTTVIISQFYIHRNEQHWKNPTKFDPDNFLPENCQGRNYYSYIPFSAGPRSCVGRKYAMLKLKVLLADVIRKFEIISLDREEDFKLQADIILKREEGFHIKVVERT
ncbi:cytochrome P450 4g1-like [Diorhabda sublineata]|uniref:cytochrome P450 4g1-like n=1 Tax=Diorhabda sublineata TaxID=1163346 RepID=UPI0024E0E100|nr:cytochrome P450 4g1-like [Diorhabda sublineata]